MLDTFLTILLFAAILILALWALSGSSFHIFS